MSALMPGSALKEHILQARFAYRALYKDNYTQVCTRIHRQFAETLCIALTMMRGHCMLLSYKEAARELL